MITRAAFIHIFHACHKRMTEKRAAFSFFDRFFLFRPVRKKSSPAKGKAERKPDGQDGRIHEAPLFCTRRQKRRFPACIKPAPAGLLE
jgi:hypothetical protein